MLNKTLTLGRKSFQTPSRSKSPLHKEGREYRTPEPFSRTEKQNKNVNNRMSRLLEEKEGICEKIHAMHQNGTPQKCLQHDVFFSSFCKNCRRIVCVNCVYGHNQHKSHTVIPIKNSESEIVLINQNMHNKIRKSLDNLTNTLYLCQTNFQTLQKNLNHSLADLKASFEIIYLTLRDKQLECEKELVRLFNLAKDCNEVLEENSKSMQKFMVKQLERMDRHRKLPDELIYMNKMYSALCIDMPADIHLSAEKEQSRPVISQVEIKQVVSKIKGLKLSPGIAQNESRLRTGSRGKISLSELITT